MTKILTPCEKQCRVNVHSICTGCGRTLEEIKDWTSMTDVQREVATGKAKVRLKTIIEDTHDRKPNYTALKEDL